MTRDQLLYLLREVDSRTFRCYSNHDCPSCSVRDNIMPELREFISWLEDEGNESYLEHKGYLHTGWLLTSE